MRHLYIFGALGLFLSALPVLAQQTGQMLIKTPGLETRLDPPPWSASDDVPQTSEVYKNEGQSENGTTFQTLQMIPKGETFEDWSELYAISVEQPLEGTFGDYVNGQYSSFTKACEQAGIYHQQDLKETLKAFIMFCSAYKAQPTQGEVAFFRMELTEKTMVKVYHHIRVPAFDITVSRDQPPLPVEELKAALQRVVNARVSKATGG